MKNTRKQEKGGIIVEVVAVIALLGVMGPMLFQQVIDRNEELENVNIANEVRTVKEAFVAYILTERDAILANCDKNDAGKCDISPDTIRNAITPYMPDSFALVPGLYNYVLTYNNKALQGYILPFQIPDKLGLKRSARIANLIGADGGIYHNGAIHGTGGNWEVADPSAIGIEFGEPVYIATTGMDTYVPTTDVQDLNHANIFMPLRSAFEQLHAWSYFSVGPGGDGRCYTLQRQTATGDGVASNDIIVGRDTGGCDPLFWVGDKTEGNVASGHVYAKNSFHVGKRNLTGGNSVDGAINLEIGNDGDTDENRKITVYDTSGTKKIEINAEGKIEIVGSRTLADTETADGDEAIETLTIHDGVIRSNKQANIFKRYSSDAGDDYDFRIDPAYTSVMNDIRLESRGGARLSEILPNYTLKNIKTFQATSSDNSDEVEYPVCPVNYKPAIVVTPVQWGASVKDLIGDITVQNDNTLAFKADATFDNVPGPVVLIQSGEDGATQGANNIHELSDHVDGAAATNRWTVTIGYSTQDIVRNGVPTIEPTITADDNRIIVIIHTYCVFDETTVKGNDVNRPLITP